MIASLTVLTDSPWMSLLGMLVVIVLVIGLAYWFTRHVVGKGKLPSFGMLRKDGDLSVLTHTQIGKDQRLAVVQAGERYFLLGITAHNISLLSELTAEEAARWKPQVTEGGDGQNPTFKEAFMDSLRNWKQR